MPRLAAIIVLLAALVLTAPIAAAQEATPEPGAAVGTELVTDTGVSIGQFSFRIIEDVATISIFVDVFEPGIYEAQLHEFGACTTIRPPIFATPGAGEAVFEAAGSALDLGEGEQVTAMGTPVASPSAGGVTALTLEVTGTTVDDLQDADGTAVIVTFEGQQIACGVLFAPVGTPFPVGTPES